MNDEIIVLLIDDSDVDNFINKAIVSKEKCVSQIITKNSGLDALEFLNSILDQPEFYPEFIFLDIRMPGMTGFEFLEEYVKLPETITNHSKIYILSSSMDPLDNERGENYSVVKGHLTKPLAHHNITDILLANS
jgi:CheY-like chemotaxis protein